jgi:hypothetical protein
MNIYDFNEFLNKKFGDRLTILTKSDKFKYRDYIDVNCKIHGDYKIRYDHLKDYGCPKCLEVSTRNKNRNRFIERGNLKHNNRYDYSKVDYNTNKDPVEIICPKHGPFKQRPDNHLSGAGCTYCNYKISKDDFIDRSKKIHKNFYSYDNSDFTRSLDKVTITCPKHGDFIQRSSSHLSGSGCPICQESIGEKLIRNYLIDKKIEFIREKKFFDFSKYIEFDFFLPKNNLCIEYDGIQHFKPVNFFGGDIRFNKIKETDKLKDDYCKENKINMLRISYKEDIKTKLDEYFK